MKISKPIIIFDLETTGKDPNTARIVELGCIKIDLDGNQTEKRYLVNPLIPIPPEATAIHGITDTMVAGAPKFIALSKGMLSFFAGCDIGGYNSNEYDIPLLSEEFGRCGLEFPEPGTNFVDVYKLAKHVTPMDLASVYKRYTGEELEGAHGAIADVLATTKVLFKILELHFDKDTSPADIDKLLQGDKIRVDIGGKLSYNEAAQVVWAIGKAEVLGKPVLDDMGFFNWVLAKDFPEDTKRILRKIYREAFDNADDPITSPV